jgi:aryl-alcohol dehydrogenase-like predicted oxidoreductase
MAWCLYNKDVSVALTGASHPDQIADSVKAVELLKRYTPEIDRKVEDIFKNLPTGALIHSTLQLTPSRRILYSPLLKQ